MLGLSMANASQHNSELWPALAQPILWMKWKWTWRVEYSCQNLQLKAAVHSLDCTAFGVFAALGNVDPRAVHASPKSSAIKALELPMLALLAQACVVGADWGGAFADGDCFCQIHRHRHCLCCFSIFRFCLRLRLRFRFCFW